MSLRTEGLHFVRKVAGGGERTILGGIDARFAAGQLTVIVGPTGVGKTTLLQLLAGLMRPSAGEVFAGEEPISRWVTAHRDRWRRSVGIAFQSPHLLPGLSVLENLMLPLVPRGLGLTELRDRSRLALERVGAAALISRDARALSGGERQRVGLARALVGAPRFLIADEPTAHQDDAAIRHVVDALAAARDGGAVVVVAAHDPRLIGSPAVDQRFELTDGRLTPCSTRLS